MGKLDINDKDYKEFKDNPNEEPVVMLNLLKFKDDGGEEAYARYAAVVTKMITDLGGRIIFAGQTHELLTGEDRWDSVLLVEYPSRKDFLNMIRSEEYKRAHVHRQEALERAVLYATQGMDLRKI
ncbi:DUF1330 domain-containing protein [Metallumcola ferriviriculae]|uniref:DUF1330 domain-containing protein n=1 Tax=Metallumcola ferriviriculae TaxID=3039180 RepID=A0AAU0UMN7_9FIRM|nr:DUF1330 domain-containing protein [Desulfitibacteraceae bacterium MK1]